MGARARGLRERLVDASLNALDALVDRAISARVQFVALAGDVYAAGINTFIAHGNHDPVDEGWSAVPASAAAVALDGNGAFNLEVWPRTWSPRNTDFRLDLDNVPKGKGSTLLPLDVVGWTPAVATPRRL